MKETKTNNEMKTTIIRDTKYSFIETSTKGNEKFSRKLEKGNVDYGNACIEFHSKGVEIKIGNEIVLNY